MTPHTPKWTPILRVEVPMKSRILREPFERSKLIKLRTLLYHFFLRYRCLKWAFMIHLNTYNTNYGLKKSWESKCQFDSQPLKIENYPKIHACSGVPHIAGKLFTRARIFLLNSSQSKVFTSSYGCPKWQKSQLKEF